MGTARQSIRSCTQKKAAPAVGCWYSEHVRWAWSSDPGEQTGRAIDRLQAARPAWRARRVPPGHWRDTSARLTCRAWLGSIDLCAEVSTRGGDRYANFGHKRSAQGSEMGHCWNRNQDWKEGSCSGTAVGRYVSQDLTNCIEGLSAEWEIIVFFFFLIR